MCGAVAGLCLQLESHFQYIRFLVLVCLVGTFRLLWFCLCEQYSLIAEDLGLRKMAQLVMGILLQAGGLEFWSPAASISPALTR